MIVAIVVAIVLAGLAVWLVSQMPIDGVFVRIARAVIVVALVLYLLSVAGLLPHGWRRM